MIPAQGFLERLGRHKQKISVGSPGGQNNFHYAWVILASSMATIVIAAVVRQSFGVFIDPLISAWGWKRGDVSLAYSISFVSAMVVSVVFGPISERMGARLTMLIGVVSFVSGVVGIGMTTTIWQCYAIAFSFGIGFGGEMPTFPIVNRQYWGELAPLNAIYSWQVGGAMMGMALGGWLGGALFDLTGGFDFSIAAAFLFTAAGLGPILGLPKRPCQSLAAGMDKGRGCK